MTRCHFHRMLLDAIGCYWIVQERVSSAEALEAEAREREGLAMSRLRSVMEVKQIPGHQFVVFFSNYLF